MILRTIIAFLFSCSVAMAGQGMGPGPGVKGYAAVGGTTLVGNTSTYSTDTSGISGNNVYVAYGGYVASASGTATKAYFHLNNSNANTCKVVVGDKSAAQGVPNVIGSTNSVATSDAGLYMATFSTGVSITQSSTYSLGIFCSGYIGLLTGGDTGVQSTSSTFPTVPSTLPENNWFGFGEFKIYLTD